MARGKLNMQETSQMVDIIGYCVAWMEHLILSLR